MPVTFKTRDHNRWASEISKRLPTTKKMIHFRKARFEVITALTMTITDIPQITQFQVTQFQTSAILKR